MKITPKQLRTIRRMGGDASIDELGDIIEVWTADEIQAYLYNVGSEYASLNDDIYAHRDSFPKELLSSWDRAYTSYIEFIKKYDESGWFNHGSMSVVRAAERFQTILEGFREKFTETLGKSPSMKTVQEKPSGFFDLSGITTIVKWVVLGGVVYAGIDYIRKRK